MECSNNIFQQILQLRQPIKADIHRVVEENYTSPISIKDLAYLSGRSLASFKRDFQNTYNMPPAKWIREQRLMKAQDMLNNSSMSVSDICYSLGVENPAHFSRIFKNKFGISPSEIRIKKS